jgi:hypothetical protein
MNPFKKQSRSRLPLIVLSRDNDFEHFAQIRIALLDGASLKRPRPVNTAFLLHNFRKVLLRNHWRY